MDAKPLFEWSDVLFQYVGFLSSFWMLGAVGFRYGILRSDVRGDASAKDLPHVSAFRDAASNAAGIGLLGAALGVVSIVEGLLKRADAKHLTFGEAVSAGGFTLAIQVVLLAFLFVSFFLAQRRIRRGWTVAGITVLAYALRNIAAGRIAGMVNPLHVLGGGLWIGTLFVLVVCGLVALMRPSIPTDEREPAVAEMVHRFSTLALFSAGLLGVTGVTTAWTHLKHVAALWTTPYGYALDAKLLVVAVVALLGAWNWRRVGPALGKDGGAQIIRRTASTELLFAALVLFFTAVLVSVPSPK